MEEVVLFFFTFLLVLLIYELFIVRKYRKDDLNESKKGKKDPFEILYLEKRYRFDMNKIPYNQLLQLVALVSSFDIALIVSIIMRFDSFFIILLGGILLTFIVIIVSYHFIYLFYKKKGMIQSGKHK